jgi:hypothetical protein
MSTLTGLKLKAAERRQRKFDADMQLPADSWDRREAESQFRTDCWEAYRWQENLERKAKAEERKASDPRRNSHCQVCGSPVLSNTGVIAHHGYRRPGWGWQTASCAGARFVRYEESCDRLKEVVAGLKANNLVDAEKRVARLAAAPAELNYTINRSKHSYEVRTLGKPLTETHTVAKPEGWVEPDYDTNQYSYYNVLRSQRRDAESVLRGLKAMIKDMDARVAAWVKVK